MDLSSLTPAKGSNKPKGKRLGRGEGSGKGGTATRGHKGAKSRSGYSRKLGFEGGQMPIQRTSPKYGFNNINHKEYKPVNLSRLQEIVDKYKVETIDVEGLIKFGVVKPDKLVKILGNGELKSKINVKAHAFSESAILKIEKIGGTVEKM
ncbi:MAG: 50S ribosomal protein L15 [Bacteroidales bacterium]